MVSDDGCGMEKEVLGRLFEPFFTTKEVGKGTGLGLSSVYGIVKQNNGYLDVRSEPGQGSKFFIYLPKADFPGHEAHLPESPKATRTILFVEDESAILNLGKKILEKFGYRVLVANSPAEALDFAANYPDPIDLLITDVIMPGMNGKQLAEKMSTLRPDLRSIYISGYTRDAMKQLHNIDGVAYLQKPFTVNSLLEKVHEALAD